MREQLQVALKNAITLRMKLPSVNYEIDKTDLTNGPFDYCYENNDPCQISDLIYHGIVEFAKNENDIDYNNLDEEQLICLQTSIRYNKNSSETTKLKYGFYGEVLLDLMSRVFFETNVLLARGYLYNPLEKGEAKGFDCFHLFTDGNNIQWWWGEAKFYENFHNAVKSVIEKLNTTFSDANLKSNILALYTYRKDISEESYLPQIINLSMKLMHDEILSVYSLVKEFNIKLIYPVLIAYQEKPNIPYEGAISKHVQDINQLLKQYPFTIPPDLNFEIFFLFLPLQEVKNIKREVFKWIDSKQPLKY